VEVQRLEDVEYERRAGSAGVQKPTRIISDIEGLRCWSTWSQMALELVRSLQI
jgi:hypothetical protein